MSLSMSLSLMTLPSRRCLRPTVSYHPPYHPHTHVHRITLHPSPASIPKPQIPSPSQHSHPPHPSIHPVQVAKLVSVDH
ncbi:hypothetical protein EX30DRAFT_342438 [Ascodesmis nigricans]|uniref:Uncharacterized protein n=1 Tax=Ascodesmis nigricans TaxID=341454 RepID=A0A4V3SIA3_9PEZI|nr:hypothetical protein EX30DRAFT_342438 [Ascodesmis nigricans]